MSHWSARVFRPTLIAEGQNAKKKKKVPSEGTLMGAPANPKLGIGSIKTVNSSSRLSQLQLFFFLNL